MACDQPITTSPPPRPALVVTVGNKIITPPVILIGEVRSRYESTQGFRVDGKIIERLVDVGAVVKKGQLLAKLDNIDTGLSSQAAQAQVRAAEAELKLSNAKLDRQRQLHEHQFISDQALEIHEAQFKVSVAQVNQVRAQAKIIGNQSRYTNLLAERDGVITEIRAEPGQVVEVGEVIARIAVPTNKEVVISVAESRMYGIAVGIPAEIRLWINPDKIYQGTVREVAPAADSATRTFQVRVTLTNPDIKVQLGMTAEVRFNNLDSNSFFLPIPAVTQREGKNIVWLIDQQSGEAQPRVVQIGMFHEEGVSIIEGLQNGELVVTAGVNTLTPGQVVRPVQVQNFP